MLSTQNYALFVRESIISNAVYLSYHLARSIILFPISLNKGTSQSFRKNQIIDNVYLLKFAKGCHNKNKELKKTKILKRKKNKKSTFNFWRKMGWKKQEDL